MQRVVRSRGFVFEAPLPSGVEGLLGLWGSISRRGAVAAFVMESGEVRTRKVEEDARRSVRRISVAPPCGCLLELEEVRDFEAGSVSYREARRALCPRHKAYIEEGEGPRA